MSNDMQQFFNGMLTLLLAKFALNDVPHAVVFEESTNGWKISVERSMMMGADVIPGTYTISQVPRKIRELIVTGPPVVEVIHIYAAEEPEERPGPLLPIVPVLKDPKKLWVVDIQGVMGTSELGTYRAFLIPELVRRHLLALQESEVMRVYPYS